MALQRGQQGHPPRTPASVATGVIRWLIVGISAPLSYVIAMLGSLAFTSAFRWMRNEQMSQYGSGAGLYLFDPDSALFGGAVMFLTAATAAWMTVRIGWAAAPCGKRWAAAGLGLGVVLWSAALPLSDIIVAPSMRVYYAASALLGVSIAAYDRWLHERSLRRRKEQLDANSRR